jgi:hypothetical protein
MKASDLAELIGDLFHQSHRLHNGKWWLFSFDKPCRELTDEEVAWHTARKHAPFVECGLEHGDSHWWDDPEEE